MLHSLMEKVLISWSGGKDSAYSLFELLESGAYEPAALLTHVTPENRAKMQGIRIELIEAQARSLGLPLEVIALPEHPANPEYEERTRAVVEKYRHQGVTTLVYGDLFLEDIKVYRDTLLKRWQMKGLYPVWQRPTASLARQMIQAGFRILVTCVDTTQLDASFAGRELDDAFLNELPESVDPCGERGEFHTFVYDGPGFQRPILFEKKGFFIKDDRFYYCDLIHPKRLAAAPV